MFHRNDYIKVSGYKELSGVRKISDKVPLKERGKDFVGFTCDKCGKRFRTGDECDEHWKKRGHCSFSRAYSYIEAEKE